MNLFELSAKLRLDDGAFHKGINNAEKRMEKLFGGIKKSAKVASIGIGAMAAAVIPVIKSAKDAYASYEQLTGGVETLFKEANVFVKQNANKAFETAGMSANQYMETVTSFSASLISSLNGDTLKAAEIADMAIVDMSDNANKMGTDITAIQNAYQGFAKQQYTMLDNLKLGYGGTKTEMERLLKDAGAITGKKYNISNLSDVYEAIHAIQTELGITGTTAKEANTTIEGSTKAFKASWENMLVAMSDPQGNIKKATEQLKSTGKTMLNNVLPAIKRSMSGFGEFIKEAAPMIGEYLPEIISETLPNLLSAGIDLASGLVTGIVDGIGKVKWSDLKPGLTKMWNALKGGLKKLGGLVFGTNEDGSIKWPTWDDVKSAFSKAWEKIKEGAKSVMKLIFGETEDGGIAWPSAEEIWAKVKAGLTAMWDEVKSLASSVLKLVFGEDKDGNIKFPTAEEIETKVKDGLTAMWDGVKTLAGEVMKLIFGEGEDGGVEFPSSEEMWAKIGEVVKTLWNGIKAYASGVLKFIFGENADGGIDWPSAEETWKKISEVVTAWWEGIKGFAKNIINLALDTLGLPDVDTIVEQINAWWADIMSKVKLWIQASFFGFDSSKGETWGESVMNDPRLPKVDLSKFDPSYFDDEHAKGLLTVPYDGYIAKLHRNERVLTASQARHQDDGVDSGLIADMIQMLGNKIGNMSIMVGKDEFGRTVVNNSGRRMKGYMGRMTRREAKAYGR